MSIRKLISKIKFVHLGARSLDAEIHGVFESKPITPITTSVDDAIAFVQRFYPGRPIGILQNYHVGMEGFAGLIGDIPGTIDLKYCATGFGKTPALALCTAALVAKGEFSDPSA